MRDIQQNKERSDEYYTSRETVKLHFQLIDKLIKKHNIQIFICPCDTPDSEYVKYLSKIECKLIFFQDMYNLDNYLDVDKEHTLVITNPPFTNITKWENWLLDNGFKFSILSGMTKSFNNRQRLFDTYIHWQNFLKPNGDCMRQQVYITNSDTFGEADFMPNHWDFNKTKERVDYGKKFYREVVDGIKFYASYNGIYCEKIGTSIFVPFGGYLVALENQGYVKIDKDYQFTPIQKQYFEHHWKRAKVDILKHYD